MSGDPLAVSIDEAADMFGVSRSTIYRLRADGFPMVKVGRRTVVPVEQATEWFARWLERQEVA